MMDVCWFALSVLALAMALVNFYIMEPLNMAVALLLVFAVYITNPYRER